MREYRLPFTANIDLLEKRHIDCPRAGKYRVRKAHIFYEHCLNFTVFHPVNSRLRLPTFPRMPFIGRLCGEGGPPPRGGG